MSMDRRCFLKFAAAATSRATGAGAAPRPNVVFILADDVGYGDFGCYGARLVRTPNIDQLARQGIRFTDAHASACVCTPSRYSFLTGQYAFRNPASDHILSGEDPLSIRPSTITVASLLKRAGYSTGVVGKWHVGVGTGSPDWNGEIRPGPLETGFDYAFYFSATNDRVPCVYIENHRVVKLSPRDPLRTSYKAKIGEEPTGKEQPEALELQLLEGHDGTIVNGISRIGYMSGGKAAWWKDEEMSAVLTSKAISFLEERRSAPFFLFFAPHSIHQPRWPHRKFRGTTRCGTRCDAIAELDSAVGAVLATLDRLNLASNTVVILSSDNGPAMDDGYLSYDLRDANGHRYAGALRGHKDTLYEGGHREPFIARWPARIRAGTESGELLCLVDMLATFAALAGEPLPTDAGADSFNMVPALLGENRNHHVRDHLVLQANRSNRLAIRWGYWKLIAGTSSEKPELYNLAEDLGETHDLASEKPQMMRQLGALLERVKRSRATRPGAG